MGPSEVSGDGSSRIESRNQSENRLMMAKPMIEPGQGPIPEDSERHWRDRERIWAGKLGRLRLGVEPLDVQLARYRRVTWVLTILPAAIGFLFLALFAAFGRLDIGLILIAILLAPVVTIAWIDFALLSRKARLYQAEREAHLTRMQR